MAKAKKSAAAKAKVGEGGYAWRKNMACVATYAVLEGDRFLNQFEDSDVPFDNAAGVKLGNLVYFPQSTTNPEIIEVISIEITRKFLGYLQKIYQIEAQDPTATLMQIVRSIAAVFATRTKTIKDLAEVVDQNIKFPDE